MIFVYPLVRVLASSCIRSQGILSLVHTLQPQHIHEHLPPLTVHLFFPYMHTHPLHVLAVCCMSIRSAYMSTCVTMSLMD